MFDNHGSTNSRGVAVLISKSLPTKLHHTSKDSDGRWIILDITIQQQRYTLVNIYGPNSDDPNFFQEIFAEMSLYSNENVILGGDLNTVLSDTDKKGGPIPHPNSAEFVSTQLQVNN